MKASVQFPALSQGMARRVTAKVAKTASVRGAATVATNPFKATDEFLHRHLGPRDADIKDMLKVVGNYSDMEALTKDTVPAQIRLSAPVELPAASSESEALAQLKAISRKNQVLTSFIGQGYYDTITPPVVLRNVLENPAWYTSYTPYQAEISQGRLESLLNFQTMVVDLTKMDISNASLLDEGTAAAEAMNMAFGFHNTKRTRFFVSSAVHPQTIDVMRTRASGVDIEVVVGDPAAADFSKGDFFAVMLQYPNTTGVADAVYAQSIVDKAHASKSLAIFATDLLSLTLIKPPGEMGADIVVGSAQRFGVPMAYGGPHAAFLAAKDEHKRRMPGRIIGVSIDAQGKRALRMAMQTREQHIRRDKATSNICTAQALLANMAAMYGVYHGPGGLKKIATRVHTMAAVAAGQLRAAGFPVHGSLDAAKGPAFFDTITVNVRAKGHSASAVQARAEAAGMNVRILDVDTVAVSFDEAKTEGDLHRLLGAVFGLQVNAEALRAAGRAVPALPPAVARTSPYMTLPVFNSHHSEHQLLRYIHRLSAKDVSLTYSMISLGSCTMKLNATSEMIPITWPEFAGLHPFAPAHQAAGYREMIDGLSIDLARITGFAAVSVQPNSGAAGEYAGLMAIRAYLHSKGQQGRNVCLIPVSAHGTNPASAVMAGMKVVVVASDEKGNVDFPDLKAKAEAHKDTLAALMVTYPSTYGVFEEGIKDVIGLVHGLGGQVYMDGANMNAQVGLTSPGAIGADVCHLNLHKTFCIPHGGGGPGVGAIGVAAHLAPFLPGHPVVPTGGTGVNVVPKGAGQTISAAPYGSAAILPISWMYIRMLGESGLTASTQTAILNANYMAARLGAHYPVLYTGSKGRVAHEFILDMRPLKAASNGAIDEVDVAKRLMDFGFHAPTMSWPVPGTLMIEPTESEDRVELDRFCDALITIRREIQDVIDGKVDPKNNALKHAPHTHEVVTSDKWDRPYSRAQAAYPGPHAAWLKEHKLWPGASRVDNVYGDRNLHCSCHPVDSYKD